jgi:aminoglycoside phosphotransferase (APT) family kinase protein
MTAAGVNPGAAVDRDRLAVYIDRTLDCGALLALTPMSIGQSNPTYVLKTDGGDFVLRKQPPGELLKSAHAIDREYRVMQALHGTGAPVPRMAHYCADASVIGTPFYLMELVVGRVFRDSALPEIPAGERRAYYTASAEALAALHKVDWRAIGLADYGRPGNYYARQIARWTGQWAQSKQRELPSVEKLCEWLPRNIPPSDDTAISHGDYKLDNLIFHPTEPKVAAIIDWELSTLGHPLADVAYSCIRWHVTPDIFGGLGGLDLDALQVPTQAEYVAEYCALTGRADTVAPFHVAFSMFRLAVILEGVLKRARQGNASSQNAHEVGQQSQAVAEAAWALVG